MKLFANIKTFAADESGAVTVDWVVLTAAIVGLGNCRDRFGSYRHQRPGNRHPDVAVGCNCCNLGELGVDGE